MNHLVKTQLKLIAMIGAVIIAVTLVSVGVQYHHHSQNKSRVERNTTQQHFWRAIAGVDSTSGETVDNLLAADLAVIRTDPAALAAFRGDSNRYGGIADAIGFDPFNGSGQNCTECGPLNSKMKKAIFKINVGYLSAVTQETNHRYDVSGYTLTAGGASIPAYLFLLWLIIGPLTWYLTWELHDEQPVGLQLALSLPLLYVVERIRDRRSKESRQDVIASFFPDHAKMLDEMDQALRRMPASDERTKLVKTREDAMTELYRQARLATSDDDDKLNALRTQLEDVTEFLKARSEVRNTLGGMNHDNEGGTN